MGRPDGRARRRHFRRGRRAEWLAVLYVRLKGYRVLARNVTTPFGEVDLVLRRNATLVIAEVKLRAVDTEIGGAVQGAQRLRIGRAARHLAAAGQFGESGDGLRIDVILLRPGRWPQHMVDAWRP